MDNQKPTIKVRISISDLIPNTGNMSEGESAAFTAEFLSVLERRLAEMERQGLALPQVIACKSTMN